MSAWWARHDGAIYAVYAATCVAYAAGAFYHYMHLQTGGVWSAPLDDVFIHFDYARSFARGYPFQWSEGNGYSSGNTSLSYPLVLGVGYWVGFRGLYLMLWAAVVAWASVVAFLWWVRKLVDPPMAQVGRWVKYLFPPAVLSMGALDWTLFSGMENAWHLGVWGACIWAVVWQCTARKDPIRARRRAWVLGVLGALLITARPESAWCVAVFGFFCALRARRAGQHWRAGIGLLVAVGLPGILLLVAQAFVNHALTGEWSANGAVAKVFLNNPYMDAQDKLERYGSLLAYIIPRLTHHHFADEHHWGLLVPILGLVPLSSPRFRPIAGLLWTQVLGWFLIISLNNQVRWHNERYAMPAVAWLMLLAAMGVAVLAHRHPWKKELPPAKPTPRPDATPEDAEQDQETQNPTVEPSPAAPAVGPDAARPSLWRARVEPYRRPVRLGMALALAGLYWHHQIPCMQDQIWFFGRASRNILDQHVTAGEALGRMRVHRILVGDAGALIYASDRPGLDLIGLGGYHKLPFARSSIHGLGASLELIERIPPSDRPDVIAIYPSWWTSLPTYFGRYLTSFPVVGNVICGGSEKVLYRADWDPLDRAGRPRSLALDERVVDELDVADLISEREHDYRISRPTTAFVDYRVLDDPSAPSRDLFDAGHKILAGVTERAELRAPRNPARLIARMAALRAVTVAVTIDGTQRGELQCDPEGSAWQEPSLPLPTDLGDTFELTLTPDAETVHYHVWVVEKLPSD